MTVKSCEKLEKSQVALTIEIGAEEFEAALQKAYLKNRKSIRVPGFRPGKAPRKMMERYYGEGIFFEEAANIVIPDAYEAAVKEQDLNVVGYPSVEPVGEISAQGFTAKAVRLRAWRNRMASRFSRPPFSLGRHCPPARS